MYAETFGCEYADFGCMSIKRLGACMRILGACLWNGLVHVCGFWVHVYDTAGCMCAESCMRIWVHVWVHVCGNVWVQSIRMLGACMRLRLGTKYADVGCKSAETFGCKVCGCWVQIS